MRANLATLLFVFASLAAPSEAAKPPAVGYPRRSRRPILTAARKRTEQPSSAQAGLAAGGLAGVALASEAIPYINTALLLLSLRQLTELRSLVDVLDLLMSGFGRLGWAVYPVFAALLVLLQVVPLFSALVLIIVAGALFGPFWGTLLVSVSLSMAATICALIGRIVSERTGFGLADLSEQAASVDAAIAAGPARTSLLLVLLLRLSPVMPFTFSNYLFGLTSTRLWVVFLGTLLGTLPSQTVYVSAGALGRQALQGCAQPPAQRHAATPHRQGLAHAAGGARARCRGDSGRHPSHRPRGQDHAERHEARREIHLIAVDTLAAQDRCPL
jgi:uncharacterized membrane protein YdjX (TVP38/TMEM64 family)